MIEGSCHSRNFRFELPRAPAWLTLCNCSKCRRPGTLQGHLEAADVQLVETMPTREYITGERMVAFRSCTCFGCTTHWTDRDPKTFTRMAVNFRLCPEKVIAGIRIRRRDGAGDDDFLD